MCAFNHTPESNWHSLLNEIGDKLASFLLWNVCNLDIYLIWIADVVESALTKLVSTLFYIYDDQDGFYCFLSAAPSILSHKHAHTFTNIYVCSFIDPAVRIVLYAHRHTDAHTWSEFLPNYLHCWLKMYFFTLKVNTKCSWVRIINKRIPLSI